MTTFASCCINPFKALSRAAAKAAGAKLRRAGALRVDVSWPRRAQVCERCPMRVIRRGVSYCGKPLLEQVERDVSIDGCGCPTISKAKSPGEHCPLDSTHHRAFTTGQHCNCKWCAV